MIVVDENLHSQRIMSAIASWYRGQVISITALRPRTIIKDDAIPALLRLSNRPTFITINSGDFWHIAEAHADYCIITFALPKERIGEIPQMLRELLQMPAFKHKTDRLGKIVRVTDDQILFYDSRHQVERLLW
jgi:hypothetical protein